MTMSVQMLLCSPSQHHLLLKPTFNPSYSPKTNPQTSLTRTTTSTTITALLSPTKESVLKDFHHHKALKVFSL